ncbi:MAG: response regulator transcription factor [Syntrophobacteraceae bacterium]|nr:response regulator transcription factor [Syntrophobacteraceae bacterium]
MKTLIAEDDFTSRTVLEAVLKKNGDEVVVTVNGAEAWQAMRHHDAPKLAIIDWMMPEMDGLEVVRLLRTLENDQPPYIIMLTSKGETADIIAGLDAGANDYLTKPFDLGELRARVNIGHRMVAMQEKLTGKVRELSQSLEEIKTLRGILPICSFCKNIRNDHGYWEQVESYVSGNSHAQFSHGICPECMKKHYSEFCDHNDGTDAARCISGEKSLT